MFFSFIFIYGMTNIPGWLFNTAVSEEILADTGLRKTMYDECGQPTRLRVTLWRSGIWTFSALVPCFLKNIAAVTSFCGCFITAING